MSAALGWLIVGAAAAVATVLFRLRVRPPRVVVPSLVLWRQVLDEPRPLTWWERVRRAVSWTVAVAIAGALAYAAVRPASRGAAAGTGRVLIVLDGSWSMLTRTSSGDTRWTRAVAAARALAAAAAGDEIAIAMTGVGLIEGPTLDTALVELALDGLRPSGGRGDAWPAIAGARAVHFITDGGVARALPEGVTLHSVFEPAPNVAVTAFAIRPLWREDAAAEAYLEVANFAGEPQPLRVILTRGPATVLDEAWTMAPGETIRQVRPLARAGDARVRVRVEAPANALPIDDEAVGWVTRAQPLRVAVVSEDPVALAGLLRHAADAVSAFTTPLAYRPGDEDVVVFDRWAPATWPARPALLLAPAPAAWLAAGEIESRPRWAAVSPHPVVAGVDPVTVTLARARGYDADGLYPVARSERGTALVSVAEAPDRRLVVTAFAAGEPGVLAAPALPVLVGNALEWLARPDTGRVERPGLLTLGPGVARVTSASGRPAPLVRLPGRTIARLDEAGFHVEDSGGARSVLVVNAGDPETSNALRTSLPPAAAVTVAPGLARRPWWFYAVLAAFLLAAAEWWTWQRRVTV